MKKLKILHLISNSGTGGAQTHLLDILKHFNRNQFELHVIAEQQGRYAASFLEVADGGLLINWKDNSFKIYNKLKNYIQKEKINILHNHLFKACIVGSFTGYKTEVKTYNNLHGELIDGVNLPTWKLLPYRWLNRLTARLGAEQIAISHFMKEQLIRQGLPSAQIHVIYNSINAKQFLYQKKEYNKNQPLQVLCIGRLHPQKGIEYLLQAAKELPEDFQFTILGDGELFPKFQIFIEKNNIKNISLKGFQKEVQAYYEQADIFVLPSRWEGFGIVLIEAMAMGLPVIASDTGGIPELIHQGKGGFLCPVGDVTKLKEYFLKLYKNPAQMGSFGAYNRQYFKATFTLETMLKKLKLLYLK